MRLLSGKEPEIPAHISVEPRHPLVMLREHEGQSGPNEIMNYREVSEYLRTPLATLYSMVHRHEIPHIRLSARGVRFRRSDLERWLDERANREVLR